MMRPMPREREADQEHRPGAPTGAAPDCARPSAAATQQHGEAREQALLAAHTDLAEHDVVERHRRVQDRVPGPLHVHAREARVHRLERWRVSWSTSRRCRRRGTRCRSCRPPRAASRPARSRSPACRSAARRGCRASPGRRACATPGSCGARRAMKRELTAGSARLRSIRRVSSSIPHLPPGQLEEHVLEIGAPVQIAQRRGRARGRATSGSASRV